MGGLAYLLIYLLSGCALVWALAPRRGLCTRLWLGLSAGMAMLMWFPSLYAFALDFTLTAQWLGALTALLTGCGALLLSLRRSKDILTPPSQDEATPPLIPALICVVPLLLIMAYMQYTHTIRPVDGALYTGQSTYGDLNLHLGIATGLVNAAYPPEYTILPGTPLGYPFLMDAASASLYMTGLPLRWAFIIPGVIMTGLVMWGFFTLSWELTHSLRATVLAFFLLFLNGGLGFGYVIDQAIKDPTAWREVFTGFYKAPANMVDHNIRWVNVMVDMLLPQRTILSGWMMVLPALWLLMRAVREKKLRLFVMLGIWAGAMPMIHTHSFLALGLISVGVMIVTIIRADNTADRTGSLGRFIAYGLIAVALAAPQLLKWTFPQTVGGGSLRFRFNWVNNQNGRLIDEYFWFWIKNVGLVYIVMVPAALYADRRGKALALGALMVYVVAELILFQPNDYDNNKLFYVAFIAMLPLAANYLVAFYDRLKGLPGRRLIAGLFLIVSFFSGALSIVRECVSEYQLYGRGETAAAAWLNENAPEHAVVLTGTQHNNAPASLAGMRLVCGTPTFLYYHGVDYSQQMADARAMFAEPAEHIDLYKAYDVQYVYISSYETSQMEVDEEAIMGMWPLAFSMDGVRIYKVEHDNAVG